MKLKASTDYGIRAVVYLAIKDRVCSSKEISEDMSIPRDYLIQLALRLRDAGVIITRPGKNGGYELAKKPEKITLAHIINAFDMPERETRHPLVKHKSNREAVTSMRFAHKVILESFQSYCSSITIKDIIDSCITENGSHHIVAAALEKESQRLQKRYGQS